MIKVRLLPTTPIFKPDDFVWYVKEESSILGFTKELADYCNKKVLEASEPGLKPVSDREVK